jgi:hypothetical protein
MLFLLESSVHINWVKIDNRSEISSKSAHKIERMDSIRQEYVEIVVPIMIDGSHQTDSNA